MPWQRWFLIHALELLPTGGFRFRVVLLLVARQNGKTTVMVVLILYRLFQDNAFRIIGAATKVELAEATWDRIVLIAELIPELADEIGEISHTNAAKSLRLDSLEEYLPQATNSKGGRGWDSELVFVDELREHRTWDSWAAISKTINAKERGQVFGVSNAGDLTAIVLRHLRKSALNAIAGIFDDDDEEDLDEELRELLAAAAIGLFEWSAREDRRVRDRDGWYEANPALNHAELTEASIAVNLSEPEWIFRTEILCQFVDSAAGGPFAEGSWEATRVAVVERDTIRPAGYCVDVSFDRRMAYIAAGWFDTEGRLRGEIAAARAGTDWVIPWLTDPNRTIPAHLVTLQTNGAPVSSLIPEFEAAGIELVPWMGTDLGRASGITFDELAAAAPAPDEDREPVITLTHGNQPALDLAAGSAQVKAAGEGWLIDRSKSSEDAAPLVAFVGVVWLMRAHGNDHGPSIYETRGVRRA